MIDRKIDRIDRSSGMLIVDSPNLYFENYTLLHLEIKLTKDSLEKIIRIKK